MKPLLAHIYEPHRIDYTRYPVYIQPKLNGIRALYQGGYFQSRDELPWKPNLLAHLSLPLRDVFSDEVILDGELYVHGWHLQDILAACTPTRLSPTVETRLIEYHVFDRVEFGRPFWERHGSVEQAITRLNGLGYLIRFVPTKSITSHTGGDGLYASFVGLGYEGAMYRIGDCPYTQPKQPNPWRHFSSSKYLSDKSNRVWHMLKRKDFQDDEFLCVGYTEGEGKRSGLVGALVCETKGGKRFHVGGGWTDREGLSMMKNPPVGRMLKVKYLILSAEGIPTGNTTLLAIL